jgi:hypothetical protein
VGTSPVSATGPYMIQEFVPQADPDAGAQPPLS